jgi:hypothetical protein
MTVYIANAAALLPADPNAKRLPKIDRLAISVARETLGKTPPGGVALIVGTCYGGLQATADFLDGVAQRGPAFGSPTAFHESVHHAPAGQISILLGMTGISLTCSDRELSGETALKAGADLIESGRCRAALVVSTDEVVPALKNAFQAFGSTLEPAEGAAAVLLTADRTDVAISIALASQPAPTLRFTCAAPERELNPSRGLIRVVEAFKAKTPARIVTFAQGGGEAVISVHPEPSAPQERGVEGSG